MEECHSVDILGYSSIIIAVVNTMINQEYVNKADVIISRSKSLHSHSDLTQSVHVPTSSPPLPQSAAPSQQKTI